MLTIGKKLLPKHDSMSVDLSSSEERDFLTQVIVSTDSPIIGKTITETLLKEIKEDWDIKVRGRGFPIKTPKNK